MNNLTRCQPHLGTYVEISVSGDFSEDSLIEASNLAFSEIIKIHDLMSFHDQESELTHINKNAASTPVKISRATKFVLEQALIMSEKTDGLFDITIAPELIAKNALPNHNFKPSPTGTWKDIVLVGDKVRFKRPVLLDLGGIAKGYAVDRAVRAVKQDINITVNAGGDLRMRPWRGRYVEVRRPDSPQSDFIRVPMKNCALATSASYYSETGVVIICKNSPANVNTDAEKSVSVFAENCMLADALTKVAYINPDMIKKAVFPDVDFMTLDSNNMITWY